MPPVSAIILHREPTPDAGPLEWLLAASRVVAGDLLSRSLGELGADEVRVVNAAASSDGPVAFALGERIGQVVAAGRSNSARESLAASEGATRGILVLGSGALPLARPADLRALLAAAAGDEPRVTAIGEPGREILALARADTLPPIPDFADATLPAWLRETGWKVRRRPARGRLGMALDGPLDVLLTSVTTVFAGRAETVHARLRAIGALLDDRDRTVLVAGATDPAALRRLEKDRRARLRALVERPAPTDGPDWAERPFRSTLSLLLDRDGPGALGRLVAEVADGALIDLTGLLVHRCGHDERGWPRAEDRYAAELLAPDAITDPWLRELTTAARDAAVPILLGGPSLVAGGLRLLPRGRR